MPKLIPFTFEKYDETTEKQVATLVLRDDVNMIIDNPGILPGEILRVPDAPSDLKIGDKLVAAKGVYVIVDRIFSPFTQRNKPGASTGYTVYYVGCYLAGEFG